MENQLADNATPSAIAPATGPVNLTISPVTLTFDTKPGQSVNQLLRIRNNGNELESLAIDIGKFTADSDGETPVLLDFEGEEEYKHWLQLSETSFTIRPGEWKEITVSFIPPDFSAFSYFYSLQIHRSHPSTLNLGENALEGGPAVLALANVDSPLSKRELQITSFKTPKLIVEFLPIHFEIGLKNTGNTYVSPTGNIFIDGNGKQDLAIIPINPAHKNVLPLTERTFEIVWNDGFPQYRPQIEKGIEIKSENNETVQQLHWDFSQADKFRIGRYQAHLLAVYDNGERDVSLDAETTFWVVPWRIGLGIFIFVLFASVGIGSTLFTLYKKLRTPAK